MLLAVLLYGPVTPRFYMRYQGYVAEVAQAMPGHRPAVITSNAPYVEDATNNVVQTALDSEEEWDYFVTLEHDNIAPPDWARVITHELDPDVHKIVGRWYFGKAQEDMRTICGYVRPNGDFDRFSYDEVQYFRQHPGLYRVGAGMPGVDDSSLTFTIGMGCTAIHRSVFENWTGKMPWFQTISSWKQDPMNPKRGKRGVLGHDINFCLEAAKQGIDVWVDTRKASGHIGEFVSDEDTYTATAQHMISRGEVDPAALSGGIKLDPVTNELGGPLTAMDGVELRTLAQHAHGKTVLEIGARLGASTFSMAKAAEIVYSVDWHRGDVWHGEAGGVGDTLPIFWRFAQKYDLRDKVVPLVGTSQQVLPILPQGHFDLVLVDGDHSYAGALFDVVQAKRLVKPGGVIAIHDFGREAVNIPEDSPLYIGVTKAAREALGEPDELIGTVAIYRAA